MRATALAALLALVGCDEGGLGSPFLATDARRAPAEDAGAGGSPGDTGPRADGGPRADAGRQPDASADASAADAGDRDAASGDPDMGDLPVDPCGFGPIDDPDEDRTVLVAQPFSPVPEVPGTEIRSLVLGSDGRLVDTGARLDVGSRPARIAVTPSGRFAVVAGEDGTVTLVEIVAPDDLQIRDVAGLPPLGPADLLMHPDGHTVFLVRQDVTEDAAGVFTLTLGCDGTLTAAPEHYGLRLAEAMALVPGRSRPGRGPGGQVSRSIRDDDDLAGRGP
ncbi:MAG: hypothetical protein R3F43_27525 [bacterium]